MTRQPTSMQRSHILRIHISPSSWPVLVMAQAIKAAACAPRGCQAR